MNVFSFSLPPFKCIIKCIPVYHSSSIVVSVGTPFFFKFFFNVINKHRKFFEPEVNNKWEWIMKIIIKNVKVSKMKWIS